MTIDPGAESWTSLPGSFEPGTLYRLRPPPAMSEAEVEHFRAALLQHGAEAVVVLPSSFKLDVILPKHGEPVRGSTPRESVFATVEDSTYADPAALRAFCEEVMTSEGL